MQRLTTKKDERKPIFSGRGNPYVPQVVGIYFDYFKLVGTAQLLLSGRRPSHKLSEILRVTSQGER